MNLNSHDYLHALKSHKIKILNTICLCTAIALLSYFVLPKTYKVSTMIGLQTQYFQLPLVSGFMPETLDPQELKAKREALIKQTLNQSFLREEANRYHLIKDPNSNYDLEQLGKKFEIIPNGPSAFLINFTGPDGTVSYQVLRDLLTRLQNIMTNERRNLLLNLHDAIQEQLETISVSNQDETPSAIYTARPDLVQHRMEKIQEEIQVLKDSYSEKHPRIAALKEQLERLSQWNHPYAEAASNAPKKEVFNGVKINERSRELFDDLIKKYRYLEVVIYMDQQNKDHYMSMLNEPYVPEFPTWPKLPILIIWGIAVGFLIGSIRVLYQQLSKGSNRLAIVANEGSVRIEEKA